MVRPRTAVSAPGGKKKGIGEKRKQLIDNWEKGSKKENLMR